MQRCFCFSDKTSVPCSCLQPFDILGCVRALWTRVDRDARHTHNEDIPFLECLPGVGTVPDGRFQHRPVSEPSLTDGSDTGLCPNRPSGTVLTPDWHPRNEIISLMFMLSHGPNPKMTNSCKQEHDTDAISENQETPRPGMNGVAICITSCNVLVAK